MAEVRGCKIPEDCYYWVEKHVWAKVVSPELVRVGMTSVAQKLSGPLNAITPKGEGKEIAKGKSLATAESSKWVGPVPAPLSGKVVRANVSLAANPKLANSDPYGEGWIAELAPSNLDEELKLLATGAEGVAQYEAFLAKEGISCA
jgi:glycine cleavage system H protein